MIGGLAELQTKVFGGQGRVGVPLQHLVHSLYPNDELQRDASERVTVIDTSLCPTVAGTIWRMEYALPDLRSPLPSNLTLGTFFHSEAGFFVRAAVVPSKSATRIFRAKHDDGRLIRIDLGGKGLPFSAGDCLGWAHARNSGLAFLVDEDSVIVEVMESRITPGDVSALKKESKFQRKARTYSVRFFAQPHSDPFGCWSSIMLGTPSMLEAGSLFNTRTQLHCCYNAPLQAKSSEMPACFGLVEAYHFGTPGYQWYHPSHCCKEVSLEKALIASIRCETSSSQSPWLTALSDAARCFGLCCSGSYHNCIAKRLLLSRQTSVGHHRRRLGGRRLRDPNGLSIVADCPAAAAVIGLLQDVSASVSREDEEKASIPIWKLYNAGSKYDSLCSLYGYDHADCCLQKACHEDSRECVACLLVEVPWAAWSLAQRRILAHVVRKLRGAMVSYTPIPATLQSALRRLLVKTDFSSKAHASVHPKQLTLLLGVLLQLVEATNGQSYLYDALHALQVGAPLELVSPLVMADFIEELPEQGSQHHVKEEVCAHTWPSDRKHAKRRKHDAASFAARDLCGVAGASLKVALGSNSLGRCCPKDAWPALVRAAAEVNFWITGVFAMCVLCVMAPMWPRNRLLEAVGLVDNYLDCPAGQTCPWQKGPCGKAAWEEILARLRAETTCILLSASMAPSSLLRPTTQAPLHTGPARLLNHGATMAFLQAGGSLMRMNDGEQLMMHPGFNHPLTRLTDTMIRLRFAASAACPGLCVGLLHPDDDASVRGLGQTHYDWWTTRGFRLTRSLFKDGIFPANQTYCFGLPTYRPKSGPSEMSTYQFAQAWDRVFANRSVLLVSPGDGLFSMRCGNCVKISEVLYGRGERVAPFRLARSMHTMHPGYIKFTSITGVEWGHVVTNVRMAAAMAKADTVAVSWGPYADILVSELACRGLRALDIGNLISILQGGEAAGQMDPDDI